MIKYNIYKQIRKQVDNHKKLAEFTKNKAYYIKFATIFDSVTGLKNLGNYINMPDFIKLLDKTSHGILFAKSQKFLLDNSNYVKLQLVEYL